MKKIKRFIFLSLCSILLLSSMLCISGCKKKKNDTIYRVSFIVDGQVQETKQVIENEYVVASSSPSKEGYEFVKWTLDGRRVTGIKEGKTGDFHFVAEWKKIVQHTITFNSDGGTDVESQTVTEGERVSEPAAPTKEGYTFIGWYDGDTKFDFTTRIAKDYTLTAKYEQISTGKKNCKKSSLAVILASTLLLSSCLVIFRKKK